MKQINIKNEIAKVIKSFNKLIDLKLQEINQNIQLNTTEFKKKLYEEYEKGYNDCKNNSYKGECKTMNNKYDFENFYQMIEFYINDGEIIPKQFDIINVEQSDEVCSIKKKIKIIEVVKREIKFDKLYITAKCKEIIK